MRKSMSRFLDFDAPSKEYVQELYDKTVKSLHKSFMELSGFLSKEVSSEDLIGNPYVMRNMRVLRERVQEQAAFLHVYNAWINYDKEREDYDNRLDALEATAQTNIDLVNKIKTLLSARDSAAAFNELAAQFNAEVSNPSDKAAVDACFNKILKTSEFK